MDLLARRCFASAEITTRHTRLFQDTPHPDTASSDWIIPQLDTPARCSSRRTSASGNAALLPGGVPIWTDAHGSPLLTLTESPVGSRWQFASRFQPAWTDLPLSTAFPAWLQALLLPPPPADSHHDFRLAAETQAQPSVAATAASSATLPPVNVSTRDLHWPLWCLAALLFGLERLLSHRRRPAPASTTQLPRSEPASAR